ncbi:MAG: hypothetical protein GWP75_03095 [Planctomycetia bacterium]|nr:hypothetical protein [Planctomycetia bacterium]
MAAGSKTSRTRRRRIIAAVAGGASVLGLITAGLAFVGPAWWFPATDDPQVAIRGNAIEQGIASTVTRVRQDAAPWGFAIGEDDVNDWLASRLDPWLAHDDRFRLPAGWTDPRIRFDEDAIRLAVRSPAGPVVVFDLVPRLESTAVILDLDGTSMGRLPVPDFLSTPMLPESLSVDGGSDRASPGFLNLPRDFELGDGRRIRIEDLEVVAGEMGIRFRTLP